MRIGLILIIVSAFLYVLHYLIFRNVIFLSEYTLFYFAFLPIEVIFLTLIIDQLLAMREKKERLDKLNMVIGAFFSEVGTGLLEQFAEADPGIETIKQDLMIGPGWTDAQFITASKQLKDQAHKIDITRVDIDQLRNFLIGKRDFLVRLLENPVVLEHESFTELLRAVFHLTEELEVRKDLSNLPASDLVHMSLDMQRAYSRLINEWLDYMRYLKNKHPYLYSLAMRMNPFDKNASPIVK